MAEPVLFAAASLVCPHGGTVQLTTRVNNRVRVSGVPVVAPGSHPVSGCALVVNGQLSPCVQVVWPGDSARVTASGVRLIIKPESGICLGVGNNPQGNPVALTQQNRVFGT